MAALSGLYSTQFYPSNVPVPGSVDISTGNTRNPNVTSAINSMGNVGGNSALPAISWLGIVIVLVFLRLASEYF